MKKAIIPFLAGSCLLTTQAISQEQQDIELLKEQVQILIDEIEKLKEQTVMPELYQQQFAGMGYAASKVYFSPQGLSIGGYGEVIYQNWESPKKDYTDTYRFIPYIGYKFTDKIILNSEIEFEHVDEAKIEFLYIDFLFNKYFNLRIGNQLIPVGLTNLLHEPVFFMSVNRPEVETKIIPSTWNENGIKIFSTHDKFIYYIGLVNSFYYNSSAGGFKGSSWVRSGRQGGGKAVAEDFAVVARFDYTGIQGLMVGVSGYRGNSGQGDKDPDENRIDGTVSIYDIHIKYAWKNFELAGLYVKGYLSDADKISTVLGRTIGKEVYGYYLRLSYDIWSFINKNYNFRLPLFIRYEEFDTQEKVADGFTKDPANKRKIWTVGLNFYPHPNVVLKADYQFRDNEAEDEPDVFELGFGFIF